MTLRHNGTATIDQPMRTTSTVCERIYTSVTVLILGAVAVGFLSVSANAQDMRPTIPEQIAKGRISVTGSGPSGSLPTVTDMLQQADLIIQGVVGQPHSYLCEDQKDVYSDYPLLNSTVLQSRTTASSPLGAKQPMVVTQRGGQITIGAKEAIELVITSAQR